MPSRKYNEYTQRSSISDHAIAPASSPISTGRANNRSPIIWPVVRSPSQSRSSHSSNSSPSTPVDVTSGRWPFLSMRRPKGNGFDANAVTRGSVDVNVRDDQSPLSDPSPRSWTLGRSPSPEKSSPSQTKMSSGTSINGSNGNTLAGPIANDNQRPSTSSNNGTNDGADVFDDNLLTPLHHPFEKTPLRSSLVKDSSRRHSPARKSVSFSSMPSEKKVSNVSECLAYMMAGSELTKVRSTTRHYRRVFTLDADCAHLRWTPTSKKPHKAKLPIGAIKEVRVGKNSEVLRNLDASTLDARDECALTIIYNDTYECLDLLAKTAEESNIWVTGLMALTSGHKPGVDGTCAVPDDNNSGSLREQWLESAFMEADLTKVGTLPEKVVIRLTKQLNDRVPVKRVKHRMKELDSFKPEHEKGQMNLIEFVEMYRDLATRPEVYFLMVRYANKDYLTWEDLQLFLETEQGAVAVSKEVCERLIQMYEPCTEGKQRCHMTVDVDIWENDEEPSTGEPVVTHGHTATGRLPVSRALAAINEYAFQTSQYPLLIRVEQHLDVRWQRWLAEQVKNTFGTRLYTPEMEDPHSLMYSRTASMRSTPSGTPCSERGHSAGSHASGTTLNANGLPGKCLSRQGSSRRQHRDRDRGRGHLPAPYPSPENLRGKILLVGKRLSPASVDATSCDWVGPVSEEDESIESVTNRRPSNRRRSRTIDMAKQLSDLMCPFLMSAKLRDLGAVAADGADVGHGKVYNVPETNALRMAQAQPDELSLVAKRKLIRVYPNSSVRVDSSNLNPLEMWNFGVQLVALNYQTPGLMMDLQEGKFRANGSTGYILKPNSMRDDMHAENPTRSRASSAAASSSTMGQQIFGAPCDCAEERTRTVKNCDFTPTWDESFQFQLAVPELALIRFLVLDDDFIGDDFIGQFTLPFECIQPGYRHIQLLNNEGESLSPASLFIHTAITNRRGGGKARKRGMSVRRRALHKVHTGVKMLGVKQLDDLFKEASVPLAECIQLRNAVEAAMVEWQDTTGMGTTSTMRQGMRLLHNRLLATLPSTTNINDVQTNSNVGDVPTENTASTLSVVINAPTSDGNAATVSDGNKAPKMGLCVVLDEHRLPTVDVQPAEAANTAPDQVRKCLVALQHLLEKSRGIIESTEPLLQKLEESTHRIADSYEELTILCSQAGLKGQKATRATENFAWNLRLLKAQLDLMCRAQMDASTTIQQVEVIDSGCTMGILVPPCKTQPCMHQPTPTVSPRVELNAVNSSHEKPVQPSAV